MVDSPEQLEMVRDACRWPPAGNRGVAFTRANLFGKYFDNYIVEAQQPLLVAMIEHVNAVENLRSILEVVGLDAILIGPYDLSASMGLTAKFDHPDFVAVMNQIRQVSESAKIPCGVHIVQPSSEELNQKLANGYRFIAYSIDAVFLNKNVTIPEIIGR